jgi:hypothetical protein
LALPPFRIFTNMADRRCNFKPNLLFWIFVNMDARAVILNFVIIQIFIIVT